jgi:outer membrane protein
MKKFLLGCVLLSTSIAFANDFKLGYVDVNKVFSTSKPAIAVQQALKNKFAPEQKNLQALNDTLVSEQSQMQAIMKKAPDMEKLVPADRAKLEALNSKFQKDQGQFQQKYMMYQQSLQRAQDFASAKVLTQANNILKTISEKGGYDLVVTSNQLVYAKPKYDLTDQVIVQLNNMDTVTLIQQLNNIENQPLTAKPGIKAPMAPVK